jgi:tRNA A-37 threonylcarbamoyl transferase component Bud32
VPAQRAPWWLYLVAASFLGFFTLEIYTNIWGPVWIGFQSDYSNGSMFLRKVSPEGAGARAGLQTGDRIVAIDGVPIRGEKDFYRAYANFEPGRPIMIKVEREGKSIEITVSLKRGSLRELEWLDWEGIGAPVFTFILALIIGIRRPYDPVARISAWFMASMAFDMAGADYGGAPVWRHLPIALSLFLWPGWISRGLLAALSVTFGMVFPRRLLQNRSVWTLIWLPVVVATLLWTLLYMQLVYRPTSDALDWFNPYLMSIVIVLSYVPATLLILGFQYRRLQDVNERRRMRVLFAGALLCGLAVVGINTIRAFFRVWYNDAVNGFLFTLYLAGPLALAYAVLRHRVFELGIILRRGLQYALARRLLVSAVPVLAAIFLLDLVLHGDQPVLAVFRARGWMYAALATLAAIAYTRRQNWLDALDRRFFREHYDARRLLREVVEEIRLAKTLEQEAPRVVTRIEAALHPEFTALLVREPRETSYRTLAAAPAGKSPPPLRKDSKLLAIMRLLGKPLEVPQTESGWLQQQLPHEETDFLRQARIDLLVPVATDPQSTEAILALGSKRSEEPYSAEDQDLLVAIAASLAILIEKPPSAAGRQDLFEECPQCGVCYDSGSTQCSKEGARLVPVILPRLLEDRYRLERRLGRGGMGTVYEAMDKSLERRVAVKVIREDLVGSQEAAERFRGEARASASFAHPNVVTVHDFGVAGGTRAYLVMEILEGTTLRERLRLESHLSAGQIISIARCVCAALSAAHRRHLVHRDLKPENIFLLSSDSGELAKVLDFGLAKFLSNSTQQQTVDTAVGGVVGTPRYMSPEQRRGEEPHHTWDLWALAVVTYEMLTGAYPFEENAPSDWFAPGHTILFTPVTKYTAQNPRHWQELFDRSFARELPCRHGSAEAFFSELLCASKAASVG